MSKPTQQEWQRDRTTVYALNVEGTNRFVAQVQGGWATQGRNRTEAEEVEANARLIAAAPELLAALSKAVDETEQMHFEAWMERACPGGDVESVQRQWLESSDYRDFVDEWCEQIDAINKATSP